jgi:hypothetical protein
MQAVAEQVLTMLQRLALVVMAVEVMQVQPQVLLVLMDFLTLAVAVVAVQTAHKAMAATAVQELLLFDMRTKEKE